MTHKSKAALLNEADVEQKFLYPLLTNPDFLAIPSDAVYPKDYMAPTKLDKAAGKKTGYYPDYSVWLLGYPTMIVEAKDPSVATEIGFREAALYARHLNVRTPTGLNPTRFILASNGVTLLAGYWDQDKPIHEFKVPDLKVGTRATSDLVKFCNIDALRIQAADFFKRVAVSRGIRPVSLAGDQALLNSKRPLNSFAPELSPVLRRYFSSTNEDNNREIAEKAYVSSVEITEYDKVLEAMLKDRVAPRRDTIVEPLRTSKNEEKALTRVIHEFATGDHAQGQLQIIQGAVGSGKSLFARRYRDLLEPQDLKTLNYWSFVDFNASPASLKGAESWLCSAFIKAFERENPSLDIYSQDVLKGAFSRRIQQRKTAYEMLRGISSDEETRARVKDILDWQTDPVGFAEGIAHYVVGVTRKNLVVVMDNVDKMNLDHQLDAFQLALWFMEKTKAFVIIQMRDETYERYKNKPPLDTFRAGIAFHIAPPRFIDVVKRRLELGIDFLSERASARQEYILDNGARVTLPAGELGKFLQSLYAIIFGRRTNVARVLEALAGRDVRKALEMFVSIVTSGHLSTTAITSTVRGEGEIPINEFHIIRILMRGDYRFFSDNSGYASNILHYDGDWIRPDNFLLSEVLYFLIINRKRIGEIGIEGYFSVARVCAEIQRLGYDRDDVFSAINYLLNRQLIIADSFNFETVSDSDCVKVQASGFVHLRILCERIEYLYGILAVTPVADQRLATQLAEFLNRENTRGDISASDKARAVELMLGFLKAELGRLREKNAFFEEGRSGAVYLVRQIEQAVIRFFNHDARIPEYNDLDLS